MRRFLAILVAALLAAGAVPTAGRIVLICRGTGEILRPVAVSESPTSCCAVRSGADGGMELANRSCCDLQFTRGHDAPSPALTAGTPPLPAVVATARWTVILPPPVLLPVSVTPTPVAPCRGPPGSPASPRAPPILS